MPEYHTSKPPEFHASCILCVTTLCNMWYKIQVFLDMMLCQWVSPAPTGPVHTMTKHHILDNLQHSCENLRSCKLQVLCYIMHMTNSCSGTYTYLYFRKISAECAGVWWGRALNKFFCISALTLHTQLTSAKIKTTRQHSTQHIEKGVKSQFLMYLNDRPKVDFIKHFSRAGPARPLL